MCLSRPAAERRRKKYVPDLRRLGALGEANYLRVCKLAGASLLGDCREFALCNGEIYLGTVTLKMIEHCKYTDTFLLEQVHNGGRWLNNPQFTVRSYHDARISEVISCCRYQRIEAVHAYPNKFMHHPDEKAQINAFLAEWLSFCLRFGHESTGLPLLGHG